MDYINNKLLSSLQSRNLSPRDKNQGIWASILLPVAINISIKKHSIEASLEYKLISIICIGLLISSYTLTIQSCVGKNYRVLKIAGILITLIMFCSQTNGKYIMLPTIALLLCYYDSFLFHLMRKCPKTFTLGEASIVLQSVILLIVSTMLNVYKIYENKPRLQMDVATTIIQIGVLAMSILACVCYYRNYFKQTFPFYILFVNISLTFLVVILQYLLKQSAFLWIFNLLFENTTRVYLMGYWVMTVVLAIIAIQFQINAAKKASSSTRKIFHVLIVAIYFPGLVFDCTLLYLASGIAFGVFIIIEIIRILNIPPIGSYLQDGFVVYSDEKDSGNLALTPIYLLVGCSLPLWLHPCPCDVTDSAGNNLLPLISGLLSIGIGDTAASVAGGKWGNHHWPGTKKTVEGTLAGILSQIAFLAAVFSFNSIFTMAITKVTVYKSLVGIIVTSLVEAKTTQVDNLVLPLIMYTFFMF